MSSQCYPSLSKVIPMVHLLLCSMKVDLSAISEDDNFYFVCLELLKNDLEEKLKLRFEKVEDVPSKALTTYFDPRYGNFNFNLRSQFLNF